MIAIFYILGLICFLLAAFGVDLFGISLGWLGLFFVFLPPVAGAAQRTHR